MLVLARSINRRELDSALRDCDVVRIAGRHAQRAFERLAHFKLYRHDPDIQAWKGTLSGIAHRFKVLGRDRKIAALLDRFPGTPFIPVARTCGLSGTQAMRVLRRDEPELYRSIRTLVRWHRRFREPAAGMRGGPSRPEDSNNKKLFESDPLGRRRRSGGETGIRTGVDEIAMLDGELDGLKQPMDARDAGRLAAA